MADELGYRIKLLGVAERTATGIEQRVHPTMVPKSSAIAQVMGVLNAVTIDADAVREITLVGPGAGGDATASAVVADIADIARGTLGACPSACRSRARGAERAPMQRHEGGYYVRLSVCRPSGRRRRHRDPHGRARDLARKHRPAALGRAARATPAGRSGESAVPVVLITYATGESAIRDALDAVSADGHVAEPPQVIRIERE